jgi:hypothetical protein
MNPALVREIESLLQEPVTLKSEKPLSVAASMLSTAAAHQMTATTVVGVLGHDDVDAFRTLVADIAAQYGLEATVRTRVGSYAVRFSRCSGVAA